MRIKAVQKIIDKIRHKEREKVKVVLNDFQKEVVEKIRSYQGKIKYQEPSEKQELQGYKARYTAKDPLGNVLIKDGEIYRTVYKDSVDKFIEMYESGILHALADFGLIPKFELTNFYTEDNPIIFKAEKLNVVPPQYWTMEMLKEEALLTLQINEILNVFGYRLVDGHPWNVAFKNSKPVLFDYGSIMKKQHPDENADIAFLGVYAYNIIPLILHKTGGYWSKRMGLNIENEIVIEPSVGIIDSNEAEGAVKKIKNPKNALMLKRITRNENRIILSSDIKELFYNTKQQDSQWGKYYGENQEDFVIDRYERVLNSVKKYAEDADTFLDLAGNAGHFASYVKKNSGFSRVISVDYDENAIELGRKLHKNEEIDFYALNCMQHPLIDMNTVAKYFKSDVVTALALTHHLLLTQKYDIDYMFNTIKQYSNKYVFIEFCPMGLFSYAYGRIPDNPDWYTTEYFEEHFKKFFKFISKEVTNRLEFEGKIYDHRIMFIGKVPD